MDAARTLSICLIVSLMGCSGNNSLSTEDALSAINLWLQIPGSASILGIREFESDNSATASVNFSNLYACDSPDHIPGKCSLWSYTGAGEARFVRYNDNRWVLNEVAVLDTRGQLVTINDNLNIEPNSVELQSSLGSLQSPQDVASHFVSALVEGDALAAARLMAANQLDFLIESYLTEASGSSDRSARSAELRNSFAQRLEREFAREHEYYATLKSQTIQAEEAEGNVAEIIFDMEVGQSDSLGHLDHTASITVFVVKDGEEWRVSNYGRTDSYIIEPRNLEPFYDSL